MGKSTFIRPRCIRRSCCSRWSPFRPHPAGRYPDRSDPPADYEDPAEPTSGAGLDLGEVRRRGEIDRNGDQRGAVHPGGREGDQREQQDRRMQRGRDEGAPAHHALASRLP